MQNVPYLKNEEIWIEVERFRLLESVSSYLAVPIDSVAIAEIVFRLRPVPFPKLFSKYKQDAAITPDLKDILIDEDARLDYAAKRIAWGKLINCGQTCVSPDYVLIDRKVKDRFLELISDEIRLFYGENPEKSNDFARVISSESVNRLSALMQNGKIVTGGTTDPAARYVAPTVIKDIKPGDPIMQEEIFGPVLPVIDFEEFNEVYGIIEQHPKPLAAYIFSRNKKLVREFIMKTQSGSAGVNETVMQIASPFLPFGGIGPSGFGRYHGKRSFDTFSNLRSVLVKSNLLDIFLRYPPYSKLKTKIVSLLMK
jgi:acyl-CoA reductase-like NAD-dependent aldehyde dehydrogenase